MSTVEPNNKTNRPYITDRPLSCFGLILRNLARRSLRTAFMVFLISLLSFTVFASSMVLESLELGINGTAEKLGADVVIVPEGYVSEVQDALFTGKPCTVYFGREWVGKIQEVEGVGKTSHQLYLSTITDSDCCDKDLQIIAFDPETDFVVQPWLKRTPGGSLSKYRIVIGNNLNYVPGDTAKFYGEKFSVAAKLDKTGMGYDNTVFMTYDTAYELVQKPVVRNFFSIGGRKNLVSMITVKVKEGYDADKVMENIATLYGGDGISVHTSGGLLSGISGSLKSFASYGLLLSGLLLVSTVLVLLGIFSITIHERKREFGILRTLGAGRARLICLIVGEAELVGMAGGILGCLAAAFLFYTFQNYLIHILNVPFLQPRFGEIALITARCLFVSLIAGFVSSLYAAVRISFAETYALVRENEA